jgi:hypothetical protein
MFYSPQIEIIVNFCSDGKKMKGRFVISITVFAAISFLGISPVSALPTLQNGDFSTPGLDGWNVGFGVTDDYGSGYANFEQNVFSSISRLSQSFTLPKGTLALSFEQQMSFEGSGPPGTDVFTVSLLNLTNNELTPLVFYYHDTDGFEQTLGTVDGEKVTLDVSSLTAAGDVDVLLALELFSEYKDNVTASVILDNVTIIPAPGAFILVLIGAATVGLVRKFNAPAGHQS